ncbi:21253_t:CDS:1, partial [Gigaspora rosea]
ARPKQKNNSQRRIKCTTHYYKLRIHMKEAFLKPSKLDKCSGDQSQTSMILQKQKRKESVINKRSLNPPKPESKIKK